MDGNNLFGKKQGGFAAGLGKPVWRQFVGNQEFQEANKGAIAAEIAAGREKAPPVERWGGSDGILERKVGDTVERMDAEPFADDPVVGVHARRSLFDREVKTAKKDESDFRFFAGAPELRGNILSDSEREKADLMGEVDRVKKHDEAVAKRADFEKKAYDAGLRARGLERMSPDEWWQAKKTGTLDRAAVVKDATARIEAADGQDAKLAERQAAVDAKLSTGVRGDQIEAVAGEAAAVRQERAAVAGEKEAAVGEIEAKRVEAVSSLIGGNAAKKLAGGNQGMVEAAKGFLNDIDNPSAMATKALADSGWDVDKAIAAAGSGEKVETGSGWGGGGSLVNSMRSSRSDATTEQLGKIKTALEGVPVAQRKTVLEDAAKMTAWTEGDTVRKLSGGAIVFNPAKLFGSKQEVVKQIAATDTTPEQKQAALKSFMSMREAAADETIATLTANDSSFAAAFEDARKSGVGNRADMVDAWAADKANRGAVAKTADTIWSGIVVNGGVGMVKTGAGAITGVLSAMGIGENAGKVYESIDSTMAGKGQAQQMRGLTGGYGVSKDLLGTVTQMAPMFVGGGIAQGMKGLAGAVTAGASVYGYGFLQGYESALSTELEVARNERGSLTGADVEEVLGTGKAQLAGFANGVQTALLSKILGGGAEAAALGNGGSMTIRDFLTKGGRTALKDLSLKKELKTVAKNIFDGMSDEAVEEGLNQVLENVIAAGVQGADRKLGDVISESLYASAMGSVVGGAAPQFNKGDRRKTAADAVAAIDPTAPPPSEEEVAAAEGMTSVDSDVQAVGEAVLINRELADIDALEDQELADAEENVAAVIAAGADPKEQREELERLKMRPKSSDFVRGAVKASEGAGFDSLTVGELAALGISEDGTILKGEELKKLGIDKPRVRMGADGETIVLTDAGLAELAKISPRGRARIPMGEADAMNETRKVDFDVPMRDGTVRRVRAVDEAAASLEAADFGMLSGALPVRVGGAKSQTPGKVSVDSTGKTAGAQSDPGKQSSPGVSVNNADQAAPPAAGGNAAPGPSETSGEPASKSYGAKYIRTKGVDGAIKRIDHLRKRLDEVNSNKDWKAGENIAQEIDNIANALIDAVPGYDWIENKDPSQPSSPNEKASTQINLPESIAQTVRDFASTIPDSELYTEEDGFGREDEIHVTVLYGLTSNDDAQARAALKGVGPITFTLGKLSLFENEKYDVLKISVDSADLKKANKALRDNTDFENDFPNYTPHVTVAYLKPGEGRKYAGGTQFEGVSITSDTVLYSGKDRAKTPINTTESTPSPAPTQGKPTGSLPTDTKPTSGDGGNVVALAKKHLAKLKKNRNLKITEGAKRSETTVNGIELNAEKIIADAADQGMNPAQQLEYFTRVVDEEIRHMAQYRAAEKLWRDSGTDQDFGPWMQAHYGAIWENDFVGAGKDGDVFTIYAKGGNEALWNNMAPWQRAMEAIRIMSQGGSETEVAKLWTKISDGLKAALQASLDAIRQFADVASPAIKSEIKNLENALKQLEQRTDKPRSGNPAGSEGKPATSKQGAGNGSTATPERPADAGQPSGANPAPSEQAPVPFAVGSRVRLPDGKVGTVRVLKGEMASVAVDGEVMVRAARVGELAAEDGGVSVVKESLSVPAAGEVPTSTELAVDSDIDKLSKLYSAYHIARINREAAKGKQSPEYYENQKPEWTPERVSARVENFVAEIDRKDVAKLDGYNNGMFDGFWKIFAARTGIKVPTSQRDKDATIRQYVGDEAYAEFQKQKAERRQKKAEEDAAKEDEWRLKNLRSRAESLKVNNDGKMMNGLEFADMMLADGWRVENISNGPIPRYTFVRGGQFLKNVKGMGAATDYAREAQKSLPDPVDAETEAFNALPQNEKDAIDSLFKPGGTITPPSAATPPTGDPERIRRQKWRELGSMVSIELPANASRLKPQPKDIAFAASRLGINNADAALAWNVFTNEDSKTPSRNAPDNLAATPQTPTPQTNEVQSQGQGRQGETQVLTEQTAVEKSPVVLTPAEEQAKNDLFDAFDGLIDGLQSPPLEGPSYRSSPPPAKLPAFQKAAQSLIAADVKTPESLAAFLEKIAPGKLRDYSEFLWRQVNSFLMGENQEVDWAGVYGGVDKQKEWIDLSEEDGPPKLDRDFAGYGEWRRKVAKKVLPNSTQIESEALAFELANAISEENAKPEYDSWQHHIVAHKIASQLIVGGRQDIMDKAAARALADEYSQWEMGRQFDGESVSAKAFDANSKGRPIPNGFERKGDMIVAVNPPTPLETVTAPPAEAKAAKKVAKAPATNTKKLKAQKEYLLAALDKAIEEASEGTDEEKEIISRISELAAKLNPKKRISAPSEKLALEYRIEMTELGKKLPKIEIEVPGDGTFRIVNIKQSIRDFHKKAKSKFPVNPPSPNEPSPSSTDPKAITPIGKPETNLDFVEIAATAISNDKTREVLQNVHSDGENLVSTDGRRLLAIKRNVAGTEEKPATFNGKTFQMVKNPEKFPPWRQVMPRKEDLKKSITLETGPLQKLLIQALAVNDMDTPSVNLWIDANGKIGITLMSPDVGMFAGGEADPETATLIGTYSPSFLMDATKVARMLGHDKMRMDYLDEMTPAMFTAGDMEYVLMPMRRQDGESAPHPLSKAAEEAEAKRQAELEAAAVEREKMKAEREAKEAARISKIVGPDPVDTPTTPDQIYDASRAAFKEASSAFRKAQEAYRKREISDEEFLKAKASFQAAEDIADVAERAFIDAKNGKKPAPTALPEPKGFDARSKDFADDIRSTGIAYSNGYRYKIGQGSNGQFYAEKTKDGADFEYVANGVSIKEAQDAAIEDAGGETKEAEPPAPIIARLNREVERMKKYDGGLTADRVSRAINEAAWSLMGDSQSAQRQAALEFLTGTRPPKAKSGVNIIAQELRKWVEKNPVDGVVGDAPVKAAADQSTPKRYIAFSKEMRGNGFRVVAVDDVNQYAKEHPHDYGTRYYDLQEKRFVAPGKNGTIKAKGQEYEIGNIKAWVEESGGLQTPEEVEARYKASDDTFTDFDRDRHKQSRDAAIALGMVSDGKPAPADRSKEMESLVKNIAQMTKTLDGTHKVGLTRAQATTQSARGGSAAKMRDTYKRQLANMAREELAAGREVPKSVLDAVGSSIEYNEKGEYAPIGKEKSKPQPKKSLAEVSAENWPEDEARMVLSNWKDNREDYTDEELLEGIDKDRKHFEKVFDGEEDAADLMARFNAELDKGLAEMGVVVKKEEPTPPPTKPLPEGVFQDVIDGMDRDIARAQDRVDKLQSINDRLHKQSANVPGSFITGRSNQHKGLMKQRGALNDRMSKAFDVLQEAEKKLKYLKERRSGYASGEFHENGQPRANSPSRQASTKAVATYGEYLRATVKKGDKITFNANPAPGGDTVKSVNQKTITLASGTAWEFDYFTPWKDGKEMTKEELKADIKAFNEKPQPLTLQSLFSFFDKLREGDVTAAEVKAKWEEYKANQKDIEKEVLKMTMKELERFQGMRKPDNKADAARMAVETIEGMFNPTDMLSYGGVIGGSDMNKARRNAMEAAVAQWTDETIQKQAQDRKDAKAAREKALNNPETLDEWKQFVRRKGLTGLSPDEVKAFNATRGPYDLEAKIMRRGESRLTPDELATYDGLRGIDRKAEAQKEAERKATVRGVKADTDSEIVETKHTKTGADLFVVKLADRVERDVYNSLNAAAKKLGGYYSSYRGGGAVPGFQFKDRATAEQFQTITKGETVDRAEAVQEKRAERNNAAAERLAALADKMDDTADKILDADRKTNTAKRAREAGYAEAGANSMKAMATTMRNLAIAIESGEATHLDGVRTRTHVETLMSLSNRAKIDAENEEGLSYSERENRKGENPTAEQIGKAKYPWPFLNETMWKWLIENGNNTPGAKRLADRIAKVFAVKPSAQSNGSYITGPEMIGVVKELLSKINRQDYTRKSIEGAFENYDRVQAMGLTDLPMLRAALREFLQYRGTKAKLDPIKAMERDLVGMKLPGFFPTPKAVIEEMLDLAGDLKGKHVLEPSAGKGDIADTAKAAGADVDVIEMQSRLRNILEARGHRVVEHDFMNLKERGYTYGDMFKAPDGKRGIMRGLGEMGSDRVRLVDDGGEAIGYYDRNELEGIEKRGSNSGYDVVLMNPPFEEGQDGEHVRRAYEFLKPGGKLVSIMGEGIFGRSDKKSQEFRDWLDSVGGEAQKLPEGSFKSSFRPTGVSTRMVVIEKPQTSLQSPPLPTEPEQSVERLRAKGKGRINQDLIDNATEQARIFGEESLGQSRLANPGDTPLARENQAIATAVYEHERLVRKDTQVQAEARRIFETDPIGLEEKLMQAAYGNGGLLTDAEQLAAEMLMNQRAREAGNDMAKHKENMVLYYANRLARQEVARTLRIGHDKFMSPEERARFVIADAIYQPSLRIEKEAREFESPQQRREFIRKESEKRLAAVEKALKAKGMKLAEVLGTVKNLELANSKLEKEILKTRNLMDQAIIKMVQKGASIAEIRQRYGKTAAEQAPEIMAKVREDALVRIREMLKSGMTREQIKEAMRDSLKSPSLGNEIDPDLEALAQLIVSEDLGYIDPPKKNTLPKTKTAKVTDRMVEKAEADSADAIARRWIESLAKSQSDTLEWSSKAKKNMDALNALIADHVKTGVYNFTDKAVALGATEEQARILDRQAIEERRRVSAIKSDAERKRNTPEQSAKRIIDSYAKSQSDTHEWTKPKENQIKKLVLEHIKSPMDDFTAKVQALGATAEQARVLDGQASVERARIEQLKVLRDMADKNPLSANWTRPTFTDGLAKFTFDTKDRSEIIARTEALRSILSATGKIQSLTGNDRAKADKLLADMNAILGKYGADVETVLKAADPVTTYRFSMTDRAHVASVARAIQAIDADIIDKVTEWTYGAVLSGLQTMAVNAMAGAHAAYDMTVGRAFESAVNFAFKNDMSATPAEVKFLVRTLAPSLSRAASNAAATWSSELPIFNEDVLGSEPDFDRMFDGHAPKIGSIGGRFGRFVRTPMRILLATDQFNMTAITAIEAGAMAYRVGIATGLAKDSPELARFIRKEVNTVGSFSYKLAAQKASKLIFTNALPGQIDPITKKKVAVEGIGDLVGLLAGLLSTATTAQTDSMVTKALQTILRITLFPFIRTPFNIMRAGIRRTLNPVSLIDIAMLIGKNSIDENGKWKWDAKGRNAEVVERVAQQMQGAALMLLMYAIAEGDDDDLDKQIVVTGSRPFSMEKRAERDTQIRAGLGPFRISIKLPSGERIGFNYGRIEPLATALGSTVDTLKSLKKGIRNGLDVDDLSKSALGGMVSMAKDKSYLKGFADTIEVMQNLGSMGDKEGNKASDDRRVKQFLAGRLAMLMPNIIKQPIREADPAFRERTDTFLGELMYQALPYGQKQAKVSPYGEAEVKTGTAAGRVIDFTDAGTTKPTPWDNMLIRWKDSGKWKNTEDGKPWFPQPIVSATFRNGKTGKEQDMTPEQLSEFKTMAGKRATAILNRMNLNIDNPQAKDIEKAKMAISTARSEVKKMLTPKFSK